MKWSLNTLSIRNTVYTTVVIEVNSVSLCLYASVVLKDAEQHIPFNCFLIHILMAFACTVTLSGQTTL